MEYTKYCKRGGYSKNRKYEIQNGKRLFVSANNAQYRDDLINVK